MKTYKIIVAHPGKQHSFRLATALKQKGLLYSYLTTVYYKEKSIILPLINTIFKGKLLKSINSRKCAYLDDSEVIQYYSILALVTLLLVRVNNGGKLYHIWNNFVTDLFGKRVAKYAIKNNVDVVVMYDTTADVCFKILSQKAPWIRLIIDSSAACNEYVTNIFENDICETKKNDLRMEAARFWNKKFREKMFLERKLSNIFLVPSQYCKKSLQGYLNKHSKVYVIPYGGNFTVVKKKIFFIGNRINFIFVGQVGYRKGVHYLLKAFESFVDVNIYLYLVGMYDPNSSLYKKYKQQKNVEFCGLVDNEKVKDYMMISDVMVIPSLSEGMTLAGLEGMGMGLPLICSTNSGVNDFVDSYENGFVIPIQDSESIVMAINWFIENKKEIPKMSVKSNIVATENTWEKYYSRMGEQFVRFLKEDDNG